MPSNNDSPEVMLLTQGQRFGQFEIIAPIGSGGMGQVYQARHLTLEEDFAIKILHPEITNNPSSVFRLRVEARTAFHLKHPNVLNIDEFNEEDGKFYLRMPLMRGLPIRNSYAVSLRDVLVLSGGRLKEGDAAVILHDILSGLAYAHEHGVIHRDLKPANILMNGKTALISDFGLVRIVGEDIFRSRVDQTVTVSKIGMPSASMLSSSSALIGTYNYMSPEQKLGAEADERSDIYAIGLIALDMLTGRTSFGMKTPSRSVKGISRDWDSFLARALEPEASARFKNAREMLDEMPQIRAQPNLLTGRAYQATRKTGSKKVRFVVAGASVAAVAVAGLLFMLLPGSEKGTTVANEQGNPDAASELSPSIVAAEGSGSGVVAPLKTAPQEGVAPQAAVPPSVQPQEEPLSSPTLVVERSSSETTSPVTVEQRPVAEPAGDIRTPEVVAAPGPLSITEQSPKPVPTAATPVVSATAAPLSASESPAPLPTAAEALVPVAAVAPTEAGVTTPTEVAGQTSVVEEAPPPPDRTWLTVTLPENVEMRMRRVEPGHFKSGSATSEIGRVSTREKVQHDASVTMPFYIGQYELTQAQYESIMSRNPSRNIAPDNPVEQLSYASLVRPGGFLDKLNEYFETTGQGNLHARLPTEEEWEYACRAGTVSAFNDGSNLNTVGSSGNTAAFAVCGRPFGTTAPVGSLAPNQWGLYDMHGNVGEITEGGVIRGGSYKSPAKDCRSAVRLPVGTSFRGDERTGVRIVVEDSADADAASSK